MEIFPAEVMTDVPRVTLVGCASVHVEQHKGLVGYQPEEVTFRTACGLLKITGKELSFKLYTASEAVVAGSLSSVSFSGNGGGQK